LLSEEPSEEAKYSKDPELKGEEGYLDLHFFSFLFEALNLCSSAS
jgi:hypothetical protein